MDKVVWTSFTTLVIAASCSTVIVTVYCHDTDYQDHKTRVSVVQLQPSRTISAFATDYFPHQSNPDLVNIISSSLAQPTSGEEISPSPASSNAQRKLKNFDPLSLSQDKLEKFFPGIRDNFSSALDNYFKKYADVYDTAVFSEPDTRYYTDRTWLNEDVTRHNTLTRAATSTSYIFTPWPIVYGTKSVLSDLTKKTESVSHLAEPEFVRVSSIFSTSDLRPSPLSTQIAHTISTTPIFGNHIDAYHSGHGESQEPDIKNLRDFIKPTPSQSQVESPPQKESASRPSRSYLREELSPSRTLSDKSLQVQGSSSHPAPSLNAVDVDRDFKKDSEPKGSVVRPSMLTIETVPMPSLTVQSTLTGQMNAGSSHVHGTYTENEIPQVLSVSFIDVSRSQDTTMSPNVPVSTKTSPATTEPSSESEPISCFSNSSLCRDKMVKLSISMKWRDFCAYPKSLVSLLQSMMNSSGVYVSEERFVMVDGACCGTLPRGNASNRSDIMVSSYITEKDGSYNNHLTLRLRRLTNNQNCKNHRICENITDYHGEEEDQPDPSPSKFLSSNTGLVTGIVVSVAAGICIVMFSAILVMKRSRSTSATIDQQQQGNRTSRSARSSLDAYSLVSFTTGHRKRQSRISLKSFLNQGFEDPEMPSRPLSLNQLTNILSNKNLLEDEFKKIPMNMPLPDTVPPGAEPKNRYANVIPVPTTRVHLTTVKPNNHVTEYINANFVRGYSGKDCEYVASQAPLPETVEDFWRMVWEQQTRMILMITMIQENGTQRCTPYFPENTLDCQRLFGDFQVSLLNKDVREHFTVSTLRLFEMEKNLFRDVIHLWYRSWPPHGVPTDPSTILSFLVETRKYSQRNAGPLVIHCSPGTGRTGTLMVLDWCMRQYDESRVVDVPRCVYKIRQDRAGAIQTQEQYIFIHEVLNEYALKVGSQSHRPSLRSLMSFKLGH